MNKYLKKLIPSPVARPVKNIWLGIRGLYYAGNKYECPICGHHFRKMLPGGFDLPVIKEKQIIGGGYRENDICPYCKSTDRDRLVFLYLKYESNFFRNYNLVLHVAPEPSLYRFFKKMKNIQYYPVTKYQEGFYYDKSVRKADLLDLNFEEGTFDWVLCNHVLEHIPEDAKAMSEIFRVLKPGGHAILQVPVSLKLKTTYEDIGITDPVEREKHFGQFDHVRIYGRDYPNRLEQAGFYVKIINQENDLMHVPPPLNKYALNSKEKLFLCTKPNSINSSL